MLHCTSPPQKRIVDLSAHCQAADVVNIQIREALEATKREVVVELKVIYRFIVLGGGKKLNVFGNRCKVPCWRAIS